MGQIPGPCLLCVVIGIEVVIAVGQAQTPLNDGGNRFCGVMQVRLAGEFE